MDRDENASMQEVYDAWFATNSDRNELLVSCRNTVDSSSGNTSVRNGGGDDV